MFSFIGQTVLDLFAPVIKTVPAIDYTPRLDIHLKTLICKELDASSLRNLSETCKMWHEFIKTKLFKIFHKNCHIGVHCFKQCLNIRKGGECSRPHRPLSIRINPTYCTKCHIVKCTHLKWKHCHVAGCRSGNLCANCVFKCPDCENWLCEQHTSTCDNKILCDYCSKLRCEPSMRECFDCKNPICKQCQLGPRCPGCKKIFDKHRMNNFQGRVNHNLFTTGRRYTYTPVNQYYRIIDRKRSRF